MSDLTQSMRDVADRVYRQLDELLRPVEGPRGRVIDAMRYACLAGGKRLRPYLVMSSANLFDVKQKNALRVAATIEMIHCYSLIHDDLPAMDDSDMRRGRPSTHNEFDEATAILAGDGLLTEAFAVLADGATHDDATIRARLVLTLANAAGIGGMVGGQMIDISGDRSNLDLAGISELQRLKTGALIKFSCIAGAILASADDTAFAALNNYADDLGLAFQVVDDLLDAEGTAEEIGKPIGQDADRDKATFVKLLGRDGARNKARELADSACARLDLFGDKAEPLRQVAQFVVDRRS
ncbi:MAG: polyprenyl synthetase family protein [Alphaproteobacteria bacterium]|nr:MAG: polyprenyl synthetase family protein [Alphaproteobacteria bacterium]